MTEHDDIEVVRERHRRVMETPVTITLTRDEWQGVLAGLYRALLSDAAHIARLDRGELTNDDREGEIDPLLVMDTMTATYVVREKLHTLMHTGEDDQATWTPEGGDDESADDES